MTDISAPSLGAIRARHASLNYLRVADPPSGTQLIDPISVPYQGMTIVVARHSGKKVDHIFYNVLNPQVDSPSDENDFSGWKEFLFPGAVLEAGEPDYDSPPAWLNNTQLRVAGFDLVTVTKAAAVPSPDDAAFAVVADNPYLYCFRQTTRGTLMLNRLRLVEVPPPPPERGASETPSPVDFVLEPAWETRFQRSQKKDLPLDETDTLGSKNMDEDPFYEPTIDLPAFTGIVNGRFAVVLVPTSDPEVRRWIVVTSSADALVVHTIKERSGVFDYSEQVPPFTLQPGLVGVSGGSFTAAPAATLYYQQEPAGRNGSKDDTVRRAARMLVSVPFAVAGHNLDAAMAVYDFGLSPEGLPAAIPESTKAVLADGYLNAEGMFVKSDEPKYSIPPAAIHVVGKLTTTAVILGQLACRTTPFVLDGGDGLVHLYYHEGTVSTPGSFRVAQFETQVSRKEVPIPWKTNDGSDSGTVSFLARRPGSTLDGFTVAVSASGVSSDRACQADISYGEASGISAEKWVGLPRELTGFAAAVNGVASPDLADPQVRNGVVPYFDYAGAVAQARIQAGGEESFILAHTRPDVVLNTVAVSQAAKPGTLDMTTTLNSTGGPVTFSWPGLPAVDAAVLVILGGDAAPSEYPYEADGSDTTLIPLEVSAGTAPATIFLFAKPGMFPDGIVVEVAVATSGKPEQCDLVAKTLARDDAADLFRLNDIPREQAGFVAAVKGNKQAAHLFFHVSPPQTSGSVPNQTVKGPAGLRQAASLLATVQLRPGPTVTTIDSGRYQAVVSQSHTVLSQPARTGARGMLAADAIVPRLPDGGQSGFVEIDNADMFSTPAATAGAWLRRDRPIALAIEKGGAMKVPVEGPKRRRLAPRRRFTFETWIKPVKSKPSRIVSYRDDSLDHGLAAARAEYQLGIDGQRNLSFGSYDSGQTCSYFQTQRNPAGKSFLLTGDFTWEVWVKPQEKPAPHGSLGLMMQTADTLNKIVPPLALGLNNDRVPTVTYRAADKSSKQLAAPASSLPPNTWTHIAVTAHLDRGTWSLALLVNGQIVARDATAVFYANGPVPFLVIGGQTATLIGELADLRYWSVWRSPAEIRGTMFVSLRDSTPGLQGYWPLSEDFSTASVASNRATATGSFWDATKQQRTQPVNSPRDDYFASLIGSVGGAPVLEVPAFLHVTHWNHVAVSFSAGGALHLNPAASFDQGQLDSVNCGNEASLDLGSSLAIDAWFAAGPSVSGAGQTILSKWGINQDDQSFQLGLTPDGRLTCSVYLDGPKAEKRLMHVFSTATYMDGRPYHVGCAFSSASKLALNNVPPVGGEANITWKLDLFVDGQPVGHESGSAPPQDAPSVSIHPSSTDLLLGMRNPSPDPETPVPIVDQAYLRGTLGRTRIWTTVPPLKQMFPESAGLAPSTPSPDSVLSEWDFTEGLGPIAVDKTGGNDGRLSSSDLWGTLLSTSDVEFYANGNKIYQRFLHSGQAPPDSNQFALGAILKGEVVEEGFAGAFDETRMWDSVRTAQQLADNRFRPIESTESHLVAYWPFGVKGEPTTNDETGGMNNGNLIGSPAPAYETSHAPVATEGPWVRDAYGGVTTDFQVEVVGRLTASDYGSAHPDATGHLTGSLKRLYGFADAFGLSLHPGFTIGSLDVVYIGQVQTAPQLIGFIEGAPPVPSENLSLPYYNSDTGRLKYLNNTLITRSQSEKDTVTYTSSTGSQTQFSLKTDGGVYAKGSSSLNLVASTTRVYDNTFKIGPQISFTWNRSGEKQSGAGLQWSESWADALGLSGEWEAKRAKQSDYLSGYIGRRFIPDNVGYALVESLTADLFSLRLPRTGAMVSSVIVPNVEYGPDRNIIIFPIRASYQKAGTLDGKIGLANDPAYGPAANLERKSYFKPSEAYEIRNAIAVERAQRLTRFEQAARSVRERQSNDGLSAGPASFTADDLDAAQQARMKRGIANTYVWTANGGLHTEQEEFGSVIESSAAGLTSDSYNAGLKVAGELALFSIGGYGTLDFLGGATIQTKSTASGSDSRTVSLTARVDGEPYLRTWNQDANDGKGSYDEGLAPGKVNAYRFISAYVPPSTDNSHLLVSEIMDDEWRRFSSDPNAVALRRANIESNAAWRVLHRVTYVSRVPPRQVANPSETVPNSNLHPPVNLAGNVGLLDMVRPKLGDHPTAAEIGKAITAVMIPVNNQPSPLGTLVPWWDEFVKAALDGKDAAKADLLYQIRLDALNYLIAGYVSSTIAARKRKVKE
jgi:hypothetical protein